MVPGLRVTLQVNKKLNTWLSGTIVNIQNKPTLRHFIKWDMKDGTWVDLAIETWDTVVVEAKTHLVMDTTDL